MLPEVDLLYPCLPSIAINNMPAAIPVQIDNISKTHI
jgi:hypothetical protein